MITKETIFVIPTHRLQDVAQNIEKYDENFWENVHVLKMKVAYSSFHVFIPHANICISLFLCAFAPLREI